MYIVNHFTLLPLNPFNLSVDREGWWCKQSVSLLWIWLLAESAQTFPSPSYVSSEDGVIWLWHLLVTLYQVFFHEYSRFDLYTYILHIYTYTVEKKENPIIIYSAMETWKYTIIRIFIIFFLCPFSKISHPPLTQS